MGPPVNFRILLVFPILCLLTVNGFAVVEVFNEEQRLEGFAEHQRRNAKMDQEREVGSPEISKKRKAWDEELAKSVDDYKAWKARQNKALDESSPEYAQDRGTKKKVERQLDDFRQDYVIERDRKMRSQKTNIRLTEEHEYGLDEPVLRADIKKRVLYGAKSPWSSGKSLTSTSAPAPNLGGDYVPPPPPPADFGAPQAPSGPDYYEPDIPPPPPPPDPGSFDEPIPPPIFDDPEF